MSCWLQVNCDLRLDPGMQNVVAISELLKPYDAKSIRCSPISTRINHVANDDDECSRSVEMMQSQDHLFYSRREPAVVSFRDAEVGS